MTTGTDVTIEVRSGVRVTPRAVANGTQFDVQGRVEWRGESGDDGTRWVPVADGSATVVNDFFGALAQRIPPQAMTDTDVAPTETHGVVTEAPDMAAPPDPLSGTYQLFVRAIIGAATKPDGSVWDPGIAMLAELVRLAPLMWRMYSASSGDPQAVLALITELSHDVAHTPGDRLDQFFSSVRLPVGVWE